MAVMCSGHVRKRDVEDRFDIEFDAHFVDALRTLEPMDADGFVRCTDDAITVAPSGRLFIRNAAMAFDAYLGASKAPSLLPNGVGLSVSECRFPNVG